MKKLFIALSLTAVLGVTLIAGIVFYIISNTKTPEIREDEKRLLFTANKLEEIGVENIYPETCEKFSVRKSAFKTSKFEYTYSFTEDTNSVSLNIKSITQIGRSNKSARNYLRGFKIGMRIGFMNDDIELKKVDWSFPDVDISENYFLVNEQGDQLGNLLLLQKGKAFLAIILAGLYFSEESEFLPQITPIISAVDTYLEDSHE